MKKEKYNHNIVEAEQQKKWIDNKTYKWINDKSYTIDTPPPTISGMLHIGHIFSYCHTDFIARYKRMKGFNVFYPMGFDDNGLPTERLVEKKYKIKAKNYDRKEFLQKCNEISIEHRKKFKNLFDQIGLSIDWSLEYNTNSPKCHKISQMSFIDLYNKGHIYKKTVPILWDSIDQTAISQAEIEEKKFDSQMNYINFDVEQDKYTVATTRPEMLPACVALLFNPNDQRYIKIKNKKALVPLFNKYVPIIADDDVKIDKGSGLVMCCTYGDEQDIIWKEKHNLKEKIIINKYGKITDLKLYIEQNNPYIDIIEGLKVKDARYKIIELLKKNNILVKEEKINHTVKCAERSGATLELLPTIQWYIKILPHQKSLIEYGAKCIWHPKSMQEKYLKWVKELKWDWCISRQRFLGVPIPAWQCNKTGKIILPEYQDLPLDPKIAIPKGYNKNDITPITDVLDTWATSSLTPNINALGINNNLSLPYSRIEQTLPASLRPQAHEIIRTWAFYTIIKSFLHNNDIPWKNIMISGWCLAKNQQKMSKSKDNIIEPLTLIEKFGADAVRYWSATANLGTDTVLSEDIMKIGKRLVTKIVNASNFVKQFKCILSPDITKSANLIDQWILQKFKDTVISFADNMERLDYCNAKKEIENFFWHDYCDNYIELVKKRLYTTQSDPISKESQSVINTINFVMQGVLKMFAPFLPFVTDHVYSVLYDTKDSIHKIGSWIDVNQIRTCEKNIGNDIIDVLSKVREWKSLQNMSIKYTIEKIVICTQNIEEFKSIEFDLINACNISSIEYQKGNFDKDKILVIQ